jgi:short-subunit dehydrogenase
MKRTLITGASSGIGRALAVELGRQGHALALAARREDELTETARLAQEAGAPETEVLATDLSVAENAQALWHQANESLGPIDNIIANAGIGRNHPVHRLQWKDFDLLTRVNYTATVALMLEAIPDMVERGSGQIVGISSIAGFRGLPASSAYCGSKAALTHFMESARIDLRPKGVHVTVVSPGFVSTPMVEDHKGPLPFLMPVDKAARIIVKGMEKKKRHIAFPWQLVLIARFGRILPAAWWDKLMSGREM